MSCLKRQDVFLTDSLEYYTPMHSNKRTANDVHLQISEVVGNGFKSRCKLDSRSPCSLSHKPGHSIDSCLEKYPDKKKAFNSRERCPPHAVLSLVDINIESLQAMLSKAVDNVLYMAKKP